jgi:hypothetical protein
MRRVELLFGSTQAAQDIRIDFAVFVFSPDDKLTTQELGDRSKKLKNEVQQQESELQAIRVALRGIVTKWEIDYLRFLMRDEKWSCRWDQDTFDRLKRFDDMGFVLPTVRNGERSFEQLMLVSQFCLHDEGIVRSVL